MGYRLMVSHDQYKQYQERMINVQNKPVHIMPISKLRNERDYDETRNYFSDKKHDPAKYQQRDISKREELSATLTGKGKYVNEYI